jgi:hypothetical protein
LFDNAFIFAILLACNLVTVSKVFEQFMVNGSAFLGNMEIEECIEKDFTFAGKINIGYLQKSSWCRLIF